MLAAAKENLRTLYICLLFVVGLALNLVGFKNQLLDLDEF